MSQERPRRPLFSAAVGMGISLDSSGLVRGRTVPVPAFHIQFGAGEGFIGFEARLFATQGSGRYHQQEASTMTAGALTTDTPVDRLALDVLLAVRPLSNRYREAGMWVQRMLGSVTVNVGLAGENAAVGRPAAVRLGPVVGVHLDIALASAGAPHPLRLRLTSRRMFGGTARAGTVNVSDTAHDLFAGLAVVF